MRRRPRQHLPRGLHERASFGLRTGPKQGLASSLPVQPALLRPKASIRQASPPVSFGGVTTKGSQGIVDTAAQEGLVGRTALLRLLEELRKQGLKGHWNGKVSEARGIGGRATSLGTVEVPVGFGGVSGVLELTVVAEDVPLLVPVNLFKALGALIDLEEGLLHLRKVNTVCEMGFLSSGHPVISLVDFGEGWHLPEVCRECRSEQQFRTEPQKQVKVAHRSFGSSALWAAASGGGVAHAKQSSPRCATPASSCKPMAAGRTNPRRKGPTRLAHRFGQALLCAAMGTLAGSGLGVATASRAQPAAVAAADPGADFEHGGKFFKAGADGQRCGVQALLAGAQPGGALVGQGHPTCAAGAVSASQPVLHMNWVHCAQCRSRWTEDGCSVHGKIIIGARGRDSREPQAGIPSAGHGAGSGGEGAPRTNCCASSRTSGRRSRTCRPSWTCTAATSWSTTVRWRPCPTWSSTRRTWM